MPLNPGCPRCPTPVARTGDDGGWSCPEHGVVPPLWRPDEASYDAFVEHLGATATFPTYLPWPLSPGWRVTDFAAVEHQGRGRARKAGQGLPERLVAAGEDNHAGLEVLLLRVLHVEIENGSVGQHEVMQ